MSVVKLLCGGYTYRTGDRRRAARRGDVLSLPEAEAARLVSLGAAVYDYRGDGVKRAVRSEACATVTDSRDESAGTYQYTSETENATAPIAEPVTEASETISAGDEGPAEEAVTEESLLAMTRRALLALAAGMGIRVGEKATKAEIARLILTADAPDAPEGSDIVV